MKVFIVQLLCPERHCIIGAAFEEGLQTFEGVKLELEEAIAKYGIRHHCGICGSKKLSYECRPTKFNSMAEAAPHLQQTFVANLRTRETLDALGVTHDEQMRVRNN